MKRFLTLCSLALVTASCVSTNTTTQSLSCPKCDAPPVERDAAVRKTLLSSVTALEGRWEVLNQDEPYFIEFQTSSGGSVVREIMGPGTPHEMTNMYSLDGNSLVMTHYCGAGNQPHMRVTQIKNDQLVFASEGVSDLASPETFYMANMTITFIDDDHISESWRGLTDGDESEMPVFEMQRVK